MKGWLLKLSILCLALIEYNAIIIGKALAETQDCSLKRLAELPMIENNTGSPFVSVLIDDQPHDVLIDTGGFWSMINPSLIGGNKVRNLDVPAQLGLNAIPMGSKVNVSSVQVGPLKLTNVDFLIAPEGYNPSVLATLGGNWLQAFDVEIDPVNKKVLFFSKKHCAGQVVHWPHQELVELPVNIDYRQKHITIPLMLNGKEITALIDTGSSETYLNIRSARWLFDITPQSPGAELVYSTKDSLGHPVESYRYRFKTLEMGDITFNNPVLTVATMSIEGPDLILGMRELRGLHLYFAYGEKKLYATTARGDIAALQAQGAVVGEDLGAQPDPLSITNAQNFIRTANDAMKKKDYDGAMAAAEKAVQLSPNYAPAYISRAAVYFAKEQSDPGLKDLDQAIRLDPKNVSALVIRSQFYQGSGDYDRALADADQAIQANPTATQLYSLHAKIYAARKQYDRAIEDLNQALKFEPKNPNIFMERSFFYRISGDNDKALADINVTIQLDPKNAVAYMQRAFTYERAGDYQLAYADDDRAVDLQPKLPGALNGRCWVGAILGKLEKALSDCNAAIELSPKSAGIRDSRAFVHFKAGRMDAALSDYSAALDINPKQASSLYGRGLVKQQKGDVTGGAADIAVAQQIDPEIAQNFGK